jgi:hypothetical protein
MEGAAIDTAGAEAGAGAATGTGTMRAETGETGLTSWLAMCGTLLSFVLPGC